MSHPETPSTPTPPPRKRRFFTCLIIALLVVIALPILAFFGAVGYMKSGGADERVVREIRKIFGDRAKIGGTTSDWLTNLRVEKISVDGPDGKPAVEVREVVVNWDTQELLSDNRIRSVVVLNPKATLARDPNAAWNLEIKPPSGSDPKYRVDQIQIKEGEASLEWQPGKSVHVQALSGSITQAGPDAPKAFAAYGVLDSLNTLALNGTLGPGAGWTARADGGVDLERDAGSILSAWLPPGASGKINLSASARTDALLVDTARAGSLHFDGTLDLLKTVLPLPGGQSLRFARNQMEARGEFVPASKAGESMALKDLHLRLAPALDFDGGLEFPADLSRLIVHDATMEVNTAALLKCFEPQLLPSTFSVRGDVHLNGLSANIPYKDTLAGLKAKVALNAPALNVQIQGIGELPSATLSASVNWPALESASVKLSGVGDLSFSLKKILLDPNRLALELVENAKIERFELDIGQFWETELGRRMLTGNFNPDAKVLPVAQFPYHVKGTLRGAQLAITSQAAGEIQRVTLNGLQIQDAAVLKWPFPFKVPPRPFSGVAALECDFKQDGTPVAFSVAQKLHTVVPKGESPTQITLSQRFSARDKGWEIGPMHVTNINIPFSELESIFEIRKQTGITASGTALMKDVEADLPAQRVKGQFAIAKSIFKIPLPPSAQKSIVGVLRSIDYPTIAAIFESYPVEELSLGELSIRGTLELDGGKVTLKGVADPSALKAILPLSLPLFGSLKEPEIAKLPGAQFALSTDTKAPVGQRAVELELDWGGGQTLALKLREAGKPEAWVASGTLNVPGPGGVKGTFDIPFDLDAQTLGPINAELAEVALEPLGQKFFKDPAKPVELGGRLQNVSLHLRTVNLKNMTSASFANGKLTAQMDNVTYSAPPALMFEKLTGPFTLDLQSRGESYGINALLRLSNYEALLNDGAVYLPPPDQNGFGALRWVGTVRREPDGWTVQQNQAAIALEDDLSAEMSGVMRFKNSGENSFEFETLRVFAKDLRRTVAKYVAPHIKDRAPWFGDVGLKGTATFDGKFNAAPGAPTRIQGHLILKGTEIALGEKKQFTIGNVDGQLPLAFVFSSPGAKTENAALPPLPPLIGTIALGALSFNGLNADGQSLELEATPNALRIKSPFKFTTLLGGAEIGSVHLRNLFTQEKNTAIDFTLATRIDINGLLRKNGARIEGMDDCVLAGEPLRCTLEQTSGLRGPWALSSQGALKAPFFGGQMVVEKLKARGVFGPAPVFGLDAALNGGMEGIRWTQFTLKNQHLGAAITGIPEKLLGKFSLRANALVRGLEFTEPSLKGLQAFVFDFDSVPFKENEYYYDGEFAMTLNRPLVRAAFPSILFGTEKIARIPFGVRAIGLQYELRDGGLYGPRPKLPNELVLEGWGTESGIGALLEKTLKQDVKGNSRNVVPWATIIKGFSTPAAPAK